LVGLGVHRCPAVRGLHPEVSAPIDEGVIRVIDGDFVLFFRREELGQTKATTINYLKNMRLLFSYIIKSHVFEDPTFPVGFDLSPCTEKITKIKLLDQKLDLLYKRTTKQQPQELFERKAEEAKSMPGYADVVKCLDKVRSGIDKHLSDLERAFAVGTIQLRSEKNSSPAQKSVSVLALYSRLIIC